MVLLERNECVITHKDNLEHLYTFENFPVFMGCVTTPKSEDLKADMIWEIERESGMIQLKKLIPLDILYQASHAAGVVGRVWQEHHKSFAAFLHPLNISNVLEIGGGGGLLAKKFLSYKKIKWTILEPNPPLPEDINSPINYIKGFYNDKFEVNKSFDCVVHSHLFEHIYEPDFFVKKLSESIEDGKYLCFSIPNMNVCLERKYTNMINFEHTVFLGEEYVDYLLAKNGFRIVKKDYFLEDHSIFYATQRDESAKPIELIEGLYERNKSLFVDYINFHEQLINHFNKKMKQYSKPIFVFGAHIFTQYLFAFGLDPNKIICILDNAITKQGKRLYGTELVVESTHILRGMDSPAVILKAGVYNKEIKEDILCNVNPDTEFWESF